MTYDFVDLNKVEDKVKFIKTIVYICFYNHRSKNEKNLKTEELFVKNLLLDEEEVLKNLIY